MLRWPGNFLHFLYLTLVLIVMGLVYGLARLGIFLFVWGAARPRTLARLRGWWLRVTMSALGATFIKMGQVMSTRPDLFAPAIIDQLRHLQDRLPPFAFRKVRATIETSTNLISWGGTPELRCRPVLRWPGNFVHFLYLTIVLIVLGLVYGLARLGIFLFVWGAARPRTLARLRGWWLRVTMSALGATFIKMGQVMSTRPDLFAPAIIDQLRHLQDRLPPFAFRKVRATIEADLGKPLAELFSEFDAQPVAAASVAQVHRARLQDGREVAVKILRPGVRRQVERDAVLLIGLAKLIALRPLWRRNDPVGHTREFVDAIHDQTDLRIEAANYARFRINFANHADVRFPEIHEALSSERILTMEFVRGSKIDALPSGTRDPKLAEVVRRTMFKMCFEDGFVHADLHPGNMVVQSGSKLVIFDCGLAKQLEDDVLAQFIDMSKCIAMGTPEDIVAHLKRFHKYLGEIDWDALRVDVEAFALNFRGKDTAKLEYGELFGEMFAIGRTHHIHPVTDMMLVFVALITAQGIGKMLEPEHNIFNTLAMYLIPILMKRNEAVPDTVEAKRAAAAHA